MISLIFSVTFVVAVLAQFINGQFDCSTLVCDPCRTKNPAVDFIFIIDASQSMQDQIDNVKLGLQGFVDEIVKQSVDAKYWVVLIGGGDYDKSELIIGGDNGTSDAAFLRTQFGRIRSAASVKGFHAYRGGLEPSFEAIRMSLGAARYNNFDHQNIGGTGRLRLRPEAKKFMIVLTDEDSDAPLYQQNYNEFGFDADEPSTWKSYVTGPFAQELKATVSAVAAADASIYMFMNPSCCSSKKQFGDPACDVSATNLGNFDRQKTMDCLSINGVAASLTGSLLASGKLARVFDVKNTGNTGFIKSFFSDVVTQAAKCDLRKRNIEDVDQTPQCVTYLCSPTTGCYIDFLCNTGCNQCNIAGKCYRSGDQNPAGKAAPKTAAGMQFCLPEKSKTAWSTCSGFGLGDTCKKYNAIPEFGYCGLEDVCTVGCKRCQIEGNCYKENFANSEVDCLKCIPTSNFSSWTDQCPKCNPPCQNGGECVTKTGTPTCDCQKSTFEGTSCETPPKCALTCKNGGVCVKTAVSGVGMCSCEGSLFKGADCTTCETDECRNAPKQCPSSCQNGGKCDTQTGSCVCQGTGFQGATCEEVMTTEATTTPASQMATIEDAFAKACLEICKERCQGVGYDLCKCDSKTNTVTVGCKAPIATKSANEACNDACAAACPAGIVKCECDAVGGMSAECKMPTMLLVTSTASLLSSVACALVVVAFTALF